MTPLETLIEQLLIGFMNGGMYALIAVGLAILYGVMDIVNVAHGELITVGGYVVFITTGILLGNPFVALFLAIIITFLVGIVIDRSLAAPLRTRYGRGVRGTNYLVLTLGLSIFLQNIMLLFAGPDYYKPPGFIGGTVPILTTHISIQRLIVLGSCICILLVLFVFFKKTKLGMAIRAVSQDVDTAQAMGVDVARIYSVTFGIAACMAGTAGALVAPILWVFPSMGFPIALKGFAIIILGGMASLPGALIGSFCLGIAEALGVWLFASEYRDMMGFLIMMAVLVLRPSGLFGKEVRVA